MGLSWFQAGLDILFLLVSVETRFAGLKESSDGSEDLEEETAWRLELVTPQRAVRAELPEGVPAPWPLPLFLGLLVTSYSILWFHSSRFSWGKPLSQSVLCRM